MKVNGILALENIKSFKGKNTLNDNLLYVKPQKIAENSALELLGNYNRGKLNLSFRGKNDTLPADNSLAVETVREEIKEILYKNERFDADDIIEITSGISGSNEILKLKRELFLNLFQNERFNGSDIFNILLNMSYDIETAKIQSDVTKTLAADEKFSPSNTVNIVSSMRSDSIDIAEFKKQFIFKEREREIFSIPDIESIVKHLDNISAVFNAQKEFINQLSKEGFLENKNIVLICKKTCYIGKQQKFN